MNIQLLTMFFFGMLARHSRLRREEGGASVLEWAIIAAVVVTAAAGLGIIITNIVTKKGAELQRCSDGGC